MLTVIDTTPAAAFAPSDRYRTFEVLDEVGIKVADLKWSYRPKNAGGSAFKLTFKGDFGMDTSFYASTKQKCVDFMEEQILVLEGRRLNRLALEEYGKES